MATIATALDTAFTPAVGVFNCQATGGQIVLERRNTSGAGWAACGLFSGAVEVNNAVAGAQFRAAAAPGSTPTFQADQ